MTAYREWCDLVAAQDAAVESGKTEATAFIGDAVTERDEVEGSPALCRCGKGYDGHDEAHRACWKVGAIWYTSWGYDQTNVEYYQVVRESKGSVWLREIGADLIDGRVHPIPDGFLAQREWPHAFNEERRVEDDPAKRPEGEMHRKGTRYVGHPYVKMDYVRHAWPYEGGGNYDTLAAGEAGH